MLANLRQSISDRIFRLSAPEVPPVTLVQRRIFILPTRQGYFFAFTLLILLVSSINYTLSLGFVLTFLLGSMAGVAMLHTWRNLAHLRIRPGRCEPVFAGETAHFTITAETPSQSRFSVAVRRRGDEPVYGDVVTGEVAPLVMPLVAARRGLLQCGRLEIFTRYPLGLFHAWSYVDFGMAVVVYPRPNPAGGVPPEQSRGASEEGIPVAGDEEFNMLRAYRAGDTPKQIAWKALAREQGLLTKEFSATASSELWLDLDDARGADIESRLSILCHWVLQADRFGQSYGLRLPGNPIRPARGEAHRTRCLEALAVFNPERMTAPTHSPYLDVKNILWLLAGMGFVVGPHLLRLPGWVTIFFAVVVGWRAWIAWYALRSPPRALMWAITIAATVGTFLTYGRIVGREAGTTLLIIMAALKLLEMRSQRDVVLSIYLGFFLVVTNFLFSQSIPLGIYMLACVWIFVATLVGFNRQGRTPTAMERLRPAGALLVQALPLMVAFFILFPRNTGPLWALPQDQRSGQTGLSETMTPGNIANLIKSDSIAFRVHFEDGLPPYQSLYWRGPVLVDFDGSAWRMPQFISQGSFNYAKRERPTRYAVTLEPHNKTWLFALDVPGGLPERSNILSDLQLRAHRPVNERLRYEVTSYLGYQYGQQATRAQLDNNLRFDDLRNPRTVALGRQWAAENPDPRSILAKASRHFATAGYTYTLEPPLLQRSDPYDDFLFNSKQGFCEHYSGSFVLLMRAAGIPARVVTGYQGGEVNPLNNELVVRQADAHAWAEIWVAEQGWVRIDPTAAVSPLRIDGGVNAALGPIGMIPSLIAADAFGLLAQLRFAWQMMNGQWEQWVVGYNMDRQRQFFSQMGFAGIDWRTLGFWLVVITFAVGGAITLGLLVRDRPPRREASLLAWNRLCSKLAAAGLARAPHEGPLDFLARVRQVRPELAPTVEDITTRYVQARYGSGATKDEVRELARRVREFRAA